MSNFFFQKKIHCHSFRIIVIPSVLLSFFPAYCHSFRIIVIPSILVSFLPNIIIPSELFRELHILTSSKSFPYPKGEKNGNRRWPYMRVKYNNWTIPNESLTSRLKRLKIFRLSFQNWAGGSRESTSRSWHGSIFSIFSAVMRLKDH